ncbi:MAG TPA: YfiR family protein [Steroidobacteraceae bacterium]|jgi:hypothetical protein
MALLRTRRCAVVLAALLALAAAVPGRAQAPPTEYEVKAVFLFNFSQFVDWPAASFADDRSPLVIGVLGSDPFGATLDEIVRGETVNGRALEVRRFPSVEQLATCHILFIDRSQDAQLEAILTALQGRSVLTVGDFAGFAQRGGMIRFVTVGNKIRLRINLGAAQQAKLAISSKLLRPAEIVETGQD